jgi:heme-degrading monooxygenase HmoA
MRIRHVVTGLSLALSLFAGVAQAAVPALDDPNTVVTVMQFTAKDAASRPELQKRMAAMRDFLRKQPGYIENVLMENRNTDAKPDYVGVSRWKSFKDWEKLWLMPEVQKLVASINEVGQINPGTFAPVKR